MKIQPSNRFWYKWKWIIIFIVAAIAAVTSAYAASQFKPQQQTVHPVGSSPKVPKTTQNDSKQIASKLSVVDRPKLGHFPYAEADNNKLVIIASYAQLEYQRFEKLSPEAALALMKLIYAARDEGVWIVPVSGFRNIADQEKLFERQIEKRGSPKAAAKLSAPPGYSEHHTGYAIDLTDGNFPKRDITFDFAQTDAFKWLELHAKEFGFEMSFPKGNLQGVSYEPWHWRFIGSPIASEIFAHK